jgi:hypothetical protein
LADQANVPRISELRYKPGVGVFDETIKQIGLSLLPALRTPDRVTGLFTDHVTGRAVEIIFPSRSDADSPDRTDQRALAEVTFMANRRAFCLFLRNCGNGPISPSLI